MKDGDTSGIVPVIQLQQLANAEQIAGLISINNVVSKRGT
jgi:hypothetical protein